MGWARRGRRLSCTTVLAAISVVAVAVTGCSVLNSSGPSAQGGSIAQGPSLAGQTYNVGSKEFDEQKVLCQLTIAALQAAKATANDKCGIVGSVPTRAALTSGAIDLYWEYTGTAWTTHLKRSNPFHDSQQQYRAVREADAANNIIWLDPTPFENTYALGVKKQTADRLSVKTLSDFAKLASSNSPDSTLCIAQEFAGRNDGLPGLEQAYGFRLPAEKIKTLDLGPIYQAVANGNPCTFGEVFTTDGRILALGLSTLTDDKSFFPRFNAAVSIRKEAFDRDPDIAGVLNPIAAKLTNDVMLMLNKQVSQDGKDPRDVARAWLQQQGFIGS
ncbi:MAG TPA: glycine betaine ABC transporter substrate-binding protein [Pseudonocardiaceae bacterium]|nr:glycine betaine ABC transporter substrate-binding protein [Pseudonocardiaceae bacterium]